MSVAKGVWRMTRYCAQQTKDDYRIQFYTDNIEYFEVLECVCHLAVDHKISQGMKDYLLNKLKGVQK